MKLKSIYIPKEKKFRVPRKLKKQYVSCGFNPKKDREEIFIILCSKAPIKSFYTFNELPHFAFGGKKNKIYKY